MSCWPTDGVSADKAADLIRADIKVKSDQVSWFWNRATKRCYRGTVIAGDHLAGALSHNLERNAETTDTLL